MGQPLRLATLPVAFLSASLLLGSCGSSSSGPTGGAVAGALDTHCTVNGVQTKTETGMCLTSQDDAGTTGDDGGATTDDAGTTEDDGGDTGGATMADCQGLESGGGDFGATMCNSAGDDDDCKYHVSWTSSPIRKDTDVTFDVTATRLFDDQPALGANVEIEAFLSDVHPTPSVNITTTEQQGAGRYQVGPVRFDQSGMWTVRFHLYQSCIDSEDSPHGHAAFYINVP